MQALTIYADVRPGRFPGRSGTDGIGLPALRAFALTRLMSTGLRRASLGAMQMRALLAVVRLGMGALVGAMFGAACGRSLLWIGVGVVLGVMLDRLSRRTARAW